MTDTLTRLHAFLTYVRSLSGDEKGEAQVFCDRLFQAFGHRGYKEAGAMLEYRVKEKGKSTKFADLFWESRLLLEMKKRGEKLEKHYDQAFEYWLNATPKRPKYVVLCNFDQFWIYDFDLQLREPVDRLTLEELPDRYTALNFLFPDHRKPQFANNQVDVTREAADKVARVYNSLVARGEDAAAAQRFILQCVVTLFAEDIDLLPKGFFTDLLQDCEQGASSSDLIGGLFRQMGSRKSARKDSRYRDISYFNGGIFAEVDPTPLEPEEIKLLLQAAAEKWSKVEPAIFGTLFESSLGKAERHALGAHFTSEADIQKVVLPTIARPWRDRIEAASTLKDLLTLRQELNQFKVLDPACGSGNFLYVAYRELKRLEAQLLAKIHENFSDRTTAAIGTLSLISTKQFYGIDTNPFAVELAKVTLMLAKKLALDEEKHNLMDITLNLELDQALPLDNLDQNIICEDALFCDWEPVDAIIGNPPFQSKNKMQQEFGAAYVQKMRSRYSQIPGRADYCVYWFRRAHDDLKANGRAGLVGTNTIRQNYSREGGLDYILANGGTITEAVSTQVWSRDAAVHVSIVNWLKGEQLERKKLYTQLGDAIDSPWELVEIEKINSALSIKVDVSQAKTLFVNTQTKICRQGQTHGHEGFLLSLDDANSLIKQSKQNRDVIFPYLTGDDLVAQKPLQPRRYIIDFHPRDVLVASKYTIPFTKVKSSVLVTRESAAKEEIKRNQEVLKDNPKAKVNRHHQNFLAKWWLLSYPRPDLIERLSNLPRYIGCARVTKRPIFEFIHSGIRPSDVVQVFSIADDYSFGVLQSGIHWAWFTVRCSTLGGTFRYTSDTIFDSFPFPQSPKLPQVKKVAAAAVKLRQLRRRVMTENQWSLRDLYRTLDLPGDNPLRKAQAELDAAVREAYDMKASDEPLQFLLSLNLEVADREAQGLPVVAPGLPPCVTDASPFITADCVTMPE
jgi:type II restriction/modification system DNA methylase subunit YeeA